MKSKKASQKIRLLLNRLDRLFHEQPKTTMREHVAKIDDTIGRIQHVADKMKEKLHGNK